MGLTLAPLGERVPEVRGRVRGLVVPSKIENVTSFPTFTIVHKSARPCPLLIQGWDFHGSPPQMRRGRGW